MAGNIVITGFMGTGKSTVGRLVAERLGWAFVDMDAAIATQVGLSVAEIFAQLGEEAFRDLETVLAAELGNRQHVVIATGGGTLLRPQNRAALGRQGLIVCLTCAPEAILARLAEDASRPLLAGDDEERRRRISALLAERAPVYNSLPIVIETTGRTTEEVAALVISAYQDEQCTSST